MHYIVVDACKHEDCSVSVNYNSALARDGAIHQYFHSKILLLYIPYSHLIELLSS